MEVYKYATAYWFPIQIQAIYKHLEQDTISQYSKKDDGTFVAVNNLHLVLIKRLSKLMLEDSETRWQLGDSYNVLGT